MTDENKIFIPLDQDESAKHLNIDTLLPRELYEKLADFVKKSLDLVTTIQKPSQFYDSNEHRSHHAILLAGSRGTGKSSVLVNLPVYLNQQHEKIYRDVHILKPVDPTLLEDHDSLFLNVIVAAILSDRKLKDEQDQNPENCRSLSQALMELGEALSNSESYQQNKGIDKLRNFVGKEQLVQKVHLFFAAALNVLGKKLLVITIDDVDTSLHQAFANLEVVRRYLTTPYVLPIISGDFDLYHDITRRDFHGRLLKDSDYKKNSAWERADGLAQEYLRKLLPLPYRLNMPEVREYLSNPAIELHENRDQNGPKWWTLECFHAWLTALHSGSVNGLENSRLELPIHSIRALTQLTARFSKLEENSAFPISQPIDGMAKIREQCSTAISAARSWQAPGLNFAIEEFERAYSSESNREKRNYSQAYQSYIEAHKETSPPRLNKLRLAKATLLKNHWHDDAQGGGCYLILDTLERWYATREINFSGSFQKTNESVLKAPLFHPLKQQEGQYANCQVPPVYKHVS